MGMPVQTHAVIVTWNPVLSVLFEQLERLEKQVEGGIIVDNGSPPYVQARLQTMAHRFGFDVWCNQQNTGVAAALNQGIAHAREAGASHVLLLDQDSLPAPDMLSELHKALDELSRETRVGAVGPAFEDLRSGAKAPFVRIGFPLNHKHLAAPGERVRCDFLITSGCLIPLPVLDAVGDMDAGLFIDNVDLEWSFRAAGKGYALYGVGDAQMGHSIGDGIRRMLLKSSFVHAPVRQYYMMRNRILLYRRAATPRTWIAQDIPRAILKLVRFSLFIAPRRSNAHAMLKGIRDGVRGRTGAIS